MDRAKHAEPGEPWVLRWWANLVAGVALMLTGLSFILDEEDFDIQALGVLVMTAGGLLVGAALIVGFRRRKRQQRW